MDIEDAVSEKPPAFTRHTDKFNVQLKHVRLSFPQVQSSIVSKSEQAKQVDQNFHCFCNLSTGIK